MLEDYRLDSRLRTYRTIQHAVSLVATFLDVALQCARIEGLQKLKATK